ncbi:MAG: hypothetical protein QXR60_02405 [Candidatus Nanoarchaeia archaeon]
MGRNPFLLSILILIILTTILATNTVAWGIVNPYIPENPVILTGGENITLQMELQNMEEDSRTIILSIKQGEELGNLRETKYNMEPMSRQPVLIDVVTTKLTKAGNHTIIISAKEEAKKSSGQVGVGLAVDSTPINIIVNNPPPTLFQRPITYVVIALILIIGYFVIKPRWKKKKIEEKAQ